MAKQTRTTQPITDKRQVKELLDVYEVGTKNHLIISFLLHTGFRVSDLLQATVGQSRRGYWEHYEQKTDKYKHIALPNQLQIEVQAYVEQEGLEDGAPLFHQDRNKERAISRQAVDKVIRRAGDMIDIRPLSAHSLRKTFGYHMYNGKHFDIAELQRIFNHSSSETTLDYIGVTTESINKKMASISFY